MKNRGLVAILLLALLAACGKFVLSPYISKTQGDRANEFNIGNIKTLEPAASGSFKIIAISDTHNYYDELQEQVDFINERSDEYAFVIVCGDVTNLGLLREFQTAKKFFERLEIPYVLVAGNHDLLSNGSSIYGDMFGAKDFSFTFKQTQFVFFNNNNWESDGKVPDLGFLERELSSSTSLNKVLVAHVSPGDRDRWNETEKDEMRALIATYGVDYFLHGHDHNPGESSFGTAVNVTVGAPSKGKVLELSISNAGVSHRFLDF